MKRVKRDIVLFAVLLIASLDSPCIASDKYVGEDAKVVTDVSLGYSYEERLLHVEIFNPVFFDGDLEVYLAFLIRDPEDDNVSEERLGTIKNDIADKLIHAKRSVDDLGRILLACVDDEKQGSTWQNYSLQKLSDVYFITSDEELKIILVDKLKEKVLDPENYNSGTALLGLYRLCEKNDFLKSETDELAMMVLASNDFCAPDQATALEVAARLGDSRVSEIACKFLDSRETPVCLKVAALASLGIVGSSVDSTIVERYTGSGDVRLRNAAKYALQNMRSKLKKN